MAENLEEYKDLDNLLETPDPLEAGRGDALDEELTKGDDSTIEGVLNEEDSNLSSFLEDLSTIDDLDDDPARGGGSAGCRGNKGGQNA